MLALVPFVDKIGFDKGMVIGYASMLLAFLLVFFGIRSYRETVSGGQISFGRAFVVGILITLISCLCYVVAWEIVYFNFLPDFSEKYTAYLVEKMKNSGATADEIATQVAKMKDMKTIYDNPLYNALITFTEPFPVGLLVTLISAFVLRKKPKGSEGSPQLART